jgi:hypothetical protein
VRDVGKIENYEGFLGANEGFRFLLDAAAIRSGVNATLHLKHGNALFWGGLDELKNHDGTPL